MERAYSESHVREVKPDSNPGPLCPSPPRRSLTRSLKSIAPNFSSLSITPFTQEFYSCNISYFWPDSPTSEEGKHIQPHLPEGDMGT